LGATSCADAASGKQKTTSEAKNDNFFIDPPS